ncbi:MAG TPA: ATP-binding protein [Steroidobacteraceae bacterium]|jgi:two-component system heavy metal sensor histidine kinase CusS|nr:ATP-binding protein [Steroidobacteraceae bacterium]
MRSISTRLAAWYALAATVTLACLFVVGYQLLESYLIHGLDLLNTSEFEQLRARLGPDYRSLTLDIVNQRIRTTTEYASVLFYFDVNIPKRGTVFYSSNLHGRAIPDVPKKHRYDTAVPGIGPLRVAEFILPPFDVTIATSSAQVRKVMDGYVEVCSGLLAAMLAVSTVIGIVLSRLALRPVRLIRETANRIGSDNLSERIPVSGVRDEISELARLLNQMFDRLESSFKQVRRFAAEASHELKTPLSLIRLQAEKLLVTGNLSAAHEEAVQMQLEELARLNSIIEELLFLSRAEARAITLQLKAQDPARFLHAFAQDARVLAEHHGRSFVLASEREGIVAFDTQRIRQVLLNLLANAVDASPREGLITLRSTFTPGIWQVSVEDQGPGVPPSERERIFERFVRLGDRGGDERGSGLGLAICRSIIALHRGRIWAEAAAGAHGLKVLFEIPATDLLLAAGAAGSPAGTVPAVTDLA